MLADKIVNGVLCLIGAAIFGALIWYGILPADVVWKIVSGELQ